MKVLPEGIVNNVSILSDRNRNNSSNNMNLKKYEIVPYEERLRKYKETRARIMGDLVVGGMRVVTKKMIKARERFQQRRRFREKISRSRK